MSQSQMQPSLSRTNWKQRLLTASVGVLFVAVVTQSFQIRHLEESVRIWKRRAQWPAIGVQFPPLATNTLRGGARVVGSRSSKTQIVAVFTTTCPNCRASVPQWRRLSTSIDTSSSVEMVWLSLSPSDSTLVYANEHGIPEAQVAVNPDPALVLAARMRGVPVTLVVDTAGVIQHIFAGQLTQVQADSVLLAAWAPRAAGPSAPKRAAQP